MNRATGIIIVGALSLYINSAVAAPELIPAARDAQKIDEARLIIRDRDLKIITVYQWEREGKLSHAWPDQKKEVPYDASVVDVKLYNFPTGQLRKLYFRAGTRTAWHTNEDDIVMYNLPMLHQVEFVGNKVFDGHPGDATIHPAGVRHHSETIEAGWKAEFAFAAQGRSGVDLIAESVRGKNVQSLVESVEGGRRKIKVAAGDKAAGRFSAMTFSFPGYTLIEARYPRGEAIGIHSNDSEKLAYVVSGRLRVTTDGIVDDIGSGDMVRLIKDRPFAREALEDSVVLEIDGSFSPAPR